MEMVNKQTFDSGAQAPKRNAHSSPASRRGASWAVLVKISKFPYFCITIGCLYLGACLTSQIFNKRLDLVDREWPYFQKKKRVAAEENKKIKPPRLPKGGKRRIEFYRWMVQAGRLGGECDGVEDKA
jgi:hypothetical protein